MFGTKRNGRQHFDPKPGNKRQAKALSACGQQERCLHHSYCPPFSWMTGAALSLILFWQFVTAPLTVPLARRSLPPHRPASSGSVPRTACSPSTNLPRRQSSFLGSSPFRFCFVHVLVPARNLSNADIRPSHFCNQASIGERHRTRGRKDGLAALR